MAYNEELAQRIQNVMANQSDVVEKKMFGGLAFMVRGHMCCGVNGDELMVRVGPDAYDSLLKKEHAREMDFTGRALKGMIYVDSAGINTDEQLKTWVDHGLSFVLSLPPK